MSCGLHHVQRFDTVPDARVEPSHYPQAMTSLYKSDFVQKEREREVRRETISKTGYSNLIVGKMSSKPKLEGSSIMHKDYRNNRLENNHWSNDNKRRDQIDHVARMMPEKRMNQTTEYREFVKDHKKDAYYKAAIKPPQAGKKDRMEQNSLYHSDFRPTMTDKGYVNPRKEYLHNVNIVRSSFSANNIGVGHTYAHPAKDSTTYHDTFRTAKPQKLPTSSYRTPACTETPTAFNNWRISRPQMPKSSVYKNSYTNQHVKLCDCPSNH